MPALLGYDSVLAALDSWEAQSCRDQLEILVLCPTMEQRLLPRGQLVVPIGSLDLYEARARGVHQARADYVVLAEDHCLPDKTWAQTILNRLDEGWDAVGPALGSGNPITGWTQASFLLGYGQWMKPSGGPASVLPGHNSVTRRAPLIELGPALERELLICAFLLRRLHNAGQRFYLEHQATMRHFDPPERKKCLRIFYRVGLGFGAMRTSGWPRAARFLYWLATPVIGAQHWVRAAMHYRRAGAKADLNPSCLAVAVVLAFSWACGEAVGALKGVDCVAPLLSFSEIKPVSRDMAGCASRS